MNKFADILNVTNATALDNLVEDTSQAEILSRMGDPNVALKVMCSGLWYSYMFNQYTIPTFAFHVFKSLTSLPPVNDELGGLLAGVMVAIKGELFNNNIFGNAKECHSHYLDMLDAYLSAGGDSDTDKQITRQESTKESSKQYSHHLKKLLSDPLSTFILIPAIDKNTPQFFETVVKHLCKEQRFDKYRQFVNRHIELDRGEHSSVTMGWLTYIMKCQPPATPDIIKAVDNVITVIALGRGDKEEKWRSHYVAAKETR